MSAEASSSGRYTASFLYNMTRDGRTQYAIKVTSPDGTFWDIQKRYNDFRDLHDEIRDRHGDSLPALPGKRFFGNQDPAFIAARQAGLERYLDGVLAIEKDQLLPTVQQFLMVPAQPGRQSQAENYQQILDDMQSKLLNLALPPGSIDETEMAKRLQKYGQAMKLHILSQPVDPIHLRSARFDSEPLTLCAANADQLEALKTRPADSEKEHGKLLEDLMDSLQQVLQPQPVDDPEKFIVPFPSCV